MAHNASSTVSLIYIGDQTKKDGGGEKGDLVTGDTVSVCCGSVVVDFEFSPFTYGPIQDIAGLEEEHEESKEDSTILVTLEQDGTVSTWTISSQGKSVEKMSRFKCEHDGGGDSSVKFHPCAFGLIAITSGAFIYILDMSSLSKEPTVCLNTIPHPAGLSFSSLAWSHNGSYIVTTSSQTGSVDLWDLKGHLGRIEGVSSPRKPITAIFVNNDKQILVSGLSQMRQRELTLIDLTSSSAHDDEEEVQMKMTLSIGKRVQFDSGSSILLTVYDQDTDCLYYAARGESTLKFTPMQDIHHPPAPTHFQMLPANIHSLSLTPKFNLDVMKCEIARVSCLTADGVLGVSFHVPRRSYLDFHSDLYPMTRASLSSVSGKLWFDETNRDLPRLVSLDPVVRKRKIKIAESGADKVEIAKDDFELNGKIEDLVLSQEPKVVLPSLKTSSLKYMTGRASHPSQHFEGIPALNQSLSQESNGLEANRRYIVVPVSGPGGRLAIIDAAKPGRLTSSMKTYDSGSDLNDFSVCRYDPYDLVVTGCEDGRVRLFKVDDGLQGSTEPSFGFDGHQSRINHVQFHPFVRNYVLSTSSDSVRIWDIEAAKQVLQLQEFPDMVLGAAFHVKRLATTCRDKYVRLSDLRTGAAMMKTLGHESPRGSRVLWIDEHTLCSTGFGAGSQRQVHLYDTRNFSTTLATKQLTVSPSIIVPHYDEDLKTLFLCGKGETAVSPLEINPSNSEVFFELPRYESSSLQQGVAFVPKPMLDIANVEVAKCWRLTQSSIEPVSFTVPRNRKEYFQDDLYPPTRDYERISSATTLVDAQPPPPSIDLCPVGMTPVSQAPAERKAAPKYTKLPGQDRVQTDSERQQQFLATLFHNAKDDGEDDTPLPQDLMEGAADDEWDD